jgi:hypothetical protein
MTHVRDNAVIVIKDGGSVKTRRKQRQRATALNGTIDRRMIDPRVWEAAMELAGRDTRRIRTVPGSTEAVRVVNNPGDK